jgi:hypothetical protein
MRNTSVLTVAFAIAIASPAPAQSADASAYAALLATPVGALPPMLSNAMLGRPAVLPSLALQYGHISFRNATANTFGGQLAIPLLARASIGVDAAYQNYSCPNANCDGHFLGGLSAQVRLADLALGSYADVARITVGFDGEAGLGKSSGDNAYSLTAGVPIALVSGPPTIRVAPFITPGIGYGHLSGDTTSTGGARFILGAGIVFQSTMTGLGVHIGVQKVFITNGDTMLGVALTYHGL